MSLPDNEPALYAPCDYCPDINQVANICIQCERRYCAKHSSTVDSNKCVQCLPYGDGHIENISEYVSPLIDKNNHIHKGRRIVPTGEGYKTLPRAISEMSDAELENFITETALKVHEVERQRDYLKVSLSTAGLEKDERQKEFIAAQKLFKLPKQSGIKITGNATLNGGKLKGVAGSAAGAGIDLKEFLKFATAMKAKATAVPSVATPSTNLVGGASTGGARPPVVSSEAVAKQAAPSSVGASNAPGPLGGGPVASHPKILPCATCGGEHHEIECPQEKAREAEIEALLAGGEPQSAQMKELLKPAEKKQELTDDDIPF